MLLTAVKAQTPAYTTLYLPDLEGCGPGPMAREVSELRAAGTSVMAKIRKMPSQGIIDGFKGTLDFYINMGIPCVRLWPKSPGKLRSTPVMAQWPAWSYAAKEWSNLTPVVQDAYRTLATNSGLSGRDMFTRSYLTGLYRYPTP